MTGLTGRLKPSKRFEQVKNFIKDEDSKLPWLVRHGRLYYATFYIVTGLFLITLALTFIAGSGSIVAAVPFAAPFALAFLLDGLLMFFLAATVGKDATPKSWRTRTKKGAMVFTALLIIARGWVAASVSTYSFFLAMMVPLWAAFVILWVAPLIFYLPTRVDEWLGLRGRVDVSDRKVDRLEKDIKRMKVERIQREEQRAQKPE